MLRQGFFNNLSDFNQNNKIKRIACAEFFNTLDSCVLLENNINQHLYQPGLITSILWGGFETISFSLMMSYLMKYFEILSADKHRLISFDVLAASFGFLTIWLMLVASMEYHFLIVDVEDSINKLIKTFESMDETSVNIIFEKKINHTNALSILKHLLDKINVEKTKDERQTYTFIKQEVSTEINKIIQFLKQQNNYGYLTDALTDVEIRNRQEKNLYIDSMHELKLK